MLGGTDWWGLIQNFVENALHYKIYKLNVIEI